MVKLGWGLFLSVVAVSAAAAPVNWVATGSIAPDFHYQSDLLPLDPQVGDAFTISIVFDDATPDALPLDPYTGYYPGAISSAALSINGETFDLPMGFEHGVQVGAPDHFGRYTIMFSMMEYGPGALNFPNLVAQLFIFNSSPSAPGSDVLPSVPPSDLSDYQVNFYLYEYQNFEQWSGAEEPIPTVVGFATGLVAAPTSVPEPASLALLGAGLLGTAFSRRRRR
jgi:hypothetical protein